MNGGTKTPMHQQGRVLLNTRFRLYQEGRPKPDKDADPYDYWNGRSSSWSVVKHVPKVETWAKSTHASGTTWHRVRLQLVATHVSGNVSVQMTVWKCGRKAYSEIKTGTPPARAHVCWNCQKEVG